MRKSLLELLQRTAQGGTPRKGVVPMKKIRTSKEKRAHDAHCYYYRFVCVYNLQHYILLLLFLPLLLLLVGNLGFQHRLGLGKNDC